MSAHAANTAFSANIRKKSHAVDLAIAPNQDLKSISSHILTATGLRPTPEDMVAMLVQEANALPPDLRTELRARINA